MTITAIPFSALTRSNLFAVATCTADFDVVLKKLGVKVRRAFMKHGPGWYKRFFILLSSGRYGALCQWENYPYTIEVSIELFDDKFLYEEDLHEILSLLNIGLAETVLSDVNTKWIKNSGC